MHSEQRRPALFLDRDGVLNVNRPDHVKGWEEFEFLPGVLVALRSLARLPVPIIVVTNQAIVNRGRITAARLADIHARMLAAVAAAGGRIDAIYACPHRPDEGCDCRKPRPGMLLQAAREWSLDLPRSVFVGDALTDLEAALAAGAQPVHVASGQGRAQRPAVGAHPQHRHGPQAEDLPAAVPWLLAWFAANDGHGN
ncbi:MAG: HAD family hydrolase [Thermoflexales bacterium]|nr:HAD family hydrolase [Thermoflexales bacterium]